MEEHLTTQLTNSLEGGLKMGISAMTAQLKDAGLDLPDEALDLLKTKITAAMPGVMDMMVDMIKQVVAKMREDEDAICSQLFGAMDMNGDGCIDQEEFVTTFYVALSEQTEAMTQSMMQVRALVGERMKE
jgi:hypothetical protein